MNCRLLVLFTVSLILFTGCQKTSTLPAANTSASSPTATSTPDELAAARSAFEKNCVTCHQKTGEGGPVKLEDGTRLKVPSLRVGHALHHPDSDFVKQITKGGDGMPAFKDKLTTEQINDLVRFVRHEFQGGQTPPAESMKPMKNMK